MAERTKRTEELASTICARIMTGRSLREICRDDEDIPSRSFIYEWIAEDETFADQYTRAMNIRAEEMFDEIIEIADDGSNDWMERRNAEGQSIGWQENGEALRRSALRVDARKWKLSKMLPKKYGDKLDLNHGGGLTVNISPEATKL